MKMRKKLLSLMLALVMTLSCIPLSTAYAEESATIDSLEFTLGTPEPKAGEEVPEIDEDNLNPVDVSVNCENCTVEYAYWNNNDYDFSEEAATTGIFTDNRNYYLVIILSAENGYIFDKNISEITVNGKEGTGTYELNDFGSMLLYVQKFTLGDPKPITVTFDSNGRGTAPQAITAEPGQMFYEVAPMECRNLYYEDGYQFYNWSLESDNDPDKAIDYYDALTEDVTFYAIWLPAIESVKLNLPDETAMTPGATVSANVTVSEGELNYYVSDVYWGSDFTGDRSFTCKIKDNSCYYLCIELSPDDGYLFKTLYDEKLGGKTDVSFNGEHFDYVYGDSEYITLVKKYVVGTPVFHTVTFNNNGYGEAFEPLSAEDGATVYTVLFGDVMGYDDLPDTDGCRFYGWYTNPEFEGEQFDIYETPIKEDVTLYAKWVELTTIEKIDLTFEIPAAGTKVREPKITYEGAQNYEELQALFAGMDGEMYTGKFKEGETYYFCLVLQTNEGYVFKGGLSYIDMFMSDLYEKTSIDDLIGITVNGEDAREYLQTPYMDQMLILIYPFKPAPAAGAYNIDILGGSAVIDGKDASKAKPGEKVEILTAPAPEGKTFDKWAVLEGDVKLEDETAENTSFIMPFENVKIEATYKDDKNYDNTDTLTDKDTTTETESDTSDSEKIMLGDADCDGEITMQDVTTIQKYLAKLVTLESFGKNAFVNADVDGNGEVNLVDVTIIQKYMAKLISVFPAEKPENDTENSDSEKNSESDVKVDSDEYSHLFDVSVDLFKMGLSKEKNTLISPLSVILAMSAATNGADGETLKEMAKYLAGYDDMEQMNILLKALQNRLVNDEEHLKSAIANSMWVRDEKERFTVNEDYKEKLKDVFSAEIFTEDFNDKKTVDKINGWIKDNTFGMIEKMIDEIDENTIIMLINAIAFEADWDKKYESDYKSDFTNYSGEKKKATFMSQDMNSYICDSDAQGFIKEYAGGKYSFAAILPNEGVDVIDYAEKMTGEHFRELMASHTTKYNVQTKLPAFKYEYELSYKEPLKEVMPLAFDPSSADLKKMLTHTDEGANAYISDVIHKTFIELTKDGTKAAAVTIIDIKDGAHMPLEYDKKVLIDRPFMYAIIDNETKLPVFMGVVLDV